MRSKQITVKEYLANLVERAHGTPDLLKGHVDFRPRVPQLANFLNEHDFIGTRQGSPVWRRNDKFYLRNAKA